MLEGSVPVKGAQNAATAVAVFKMAGGAHVERLILDEIRNISEPTRMAMLGMVRPHVEFVVKGEPIESSPGSQEWSVRFLAYVRET
ncbi:MAG TPA: hypothetical protein VMT03_17805 [Polyangia bacterium]|nr:hypothetical protein [Polyangia bacterium]